MVGVDFKHELVDNQDLVDVLVQPPLILGICLSKFMDDGNNSRCDSNQVARYSVKWIGLTQCEEVVQFVCQICYRTDSMVIFFLEFPEFVDVVPSFDSCMTK